jgi:hypothetical protein
MGRFATAAFVGVFSLAACSTDATSTKSEVTESEAVATATTNVAPTSALTETAIETTVETVLNATSTPTPPPQALVHQPDAVVVPFDVARNEARPLKETVKSLGAVPTDSLSMKITGIAYRGLICGFSFLGDAPTGPVTIQQRVQSPTGTFDSGPIAVSWTGTDDDTVEAGSSQDQTWNFSAEAHKNRSGPGWVVSIGGVTASNGGDDVAVTPTDGSCEIRSTKKVFTETVGPVGYWAGFAVT